ncbi:MAG TPA: hypothetical protein VGR37_08740 [Longimicrobiaceae bacterium]|nr:hypothetical protein [Longimicrobiaceae bacterium]
MADLGMLQRRGFVWLALLLGILAVVAVLWMLSAMVDGSAADLEVDVDAGGSAAAVSVPERSGGAGLAFRR